jgi:glycyl-tRNA synthetase beta chain
MPELLIELLSEEIPARMQARGAGDLARLVANGLTAAGLTHARPREFWTPRRLALIVEDVPARQDDRTEEKRGPRADAPAAAIEGFLRGAGVTLDQCERRETPKGTFLFATVAIKGLPTGQVIAALMPQVLADFPWPKSMRWGANRERWVRPLHGILCLFDGVAVPFAFGSVAVAHRSAGHRFLAPQPFPVKSVAEYMSGLASGYVVLDAHERRQQISRQAAELAAAQGLRVREDDGLLAEVADLVEWPVVMMGEIDPAFMDLPPEVLITAMRAHQRYFAIEDEAGRLQPRFAVVSNMAADDGGEAIRKGNERVLRARLADARYFWDRDRGVTLEDRVAELGRVVFHAKLGTLEEKAERIRVLARVLAPRVKGADADLAERAARLAKADLVSGMVGEFPELQGVMGGYYATAAGEDARVTLAIAQHYAPAGPSDACPTAPESVVVALADKIDTLTGFFAAGETPTGSKDPFALRRAAQGVIRLIIENGLRLNLYEVFRTAYAGYETFDTSAEETAASLLVFFADRLKVHLRDKGVRHDLIAAVFALGSEDDLVRLLKRVDALASFLATEDGVNLLTAYRRAGNIVAIEAKKDKVSGFDGAVDAALLSDPIEQRLHPLVVAAVGLVNAHVQDENFAEAMRVLAGLRQPIDAFFDQVTVNADDPAVRVNRLRLLAGVRAALGRVADLDRIEA